MRKNLFFTIQLSRGAKKASLNLFDVTVGTYYGAKSCELVAAFLLHKIKSKYGNNFGLYRDDGLGVTRSSHVEMIKKDLCSIFSKYGLKIATELNKKIVIFLDNTLYRWYIHALFQAQQHTI